MNSLLRTAIGLLALSAVVANAQSLYNPTRPAKDQGMSFKSWGGGTISETDETGFEGTSSIRVSSRNYFQGGIVTFATPIDLKAAYDDKNNLVQFTLQVPTPSGGNSGPIGGGGGGKGPGSGLAGGGTDDDPRGAGAPGGRGQTPTNQGATMTTTKSLEMLRLVITTTDGLRSEAFLDLKGKVPDQRGWLKSGIPLQAIAGFGRTNKLIQSIALAGDTSGTFYVGEMNILNDSTPVYGELNEGNMNLALGDERTLIASGYGGSSPLKFEWDFDAADGIQVDATGQTVKRKFRKPGKYTITLTVTDVYGLKKAHTSTIEVEVNP